MTGGSPPRPSHPKIEVEVDENLARDLLLEQHPDLAGLPMRGRVNGWDNLTWRLGDDLALRFPVREASSGLVEREQTWLPHLAPMLPVAVPTPLRAGRPGPRYPWSWSVVPWLPGTVAAATDPVDRTAWAAELADVLAALHVRAPDDAPANPYRGVPLATRDAAVTVRFDDAALPHADALRSAWVDGLGAPPFTGVPLWVHGDPHPGNLLAHDGRISGLIDFGDLCSGDPASDLATAWLTFDEAGREVFVARTQELRGWDGAMWRRARAWAAAMVPVLLAHPVEYPLLAAAGRHTAAQVAQG